MRIEPPLESAAQDVPVEQRLDDRDYSPSINPEGPEQQEQQEEALPEEEVADQEQEAEPPVPAAPEDPFLPEEESGDEQEAERVYQSQMRTHSWKPKDMRLVKEPVPKHVRNGKQYQARRDAKDWRMMFQRV